jgi:hypothetical protein
VGNAAYSLDGASLIDLPVAERYGAIIGQQDEDLVLETEKGVRWVYKQFTRTYRKVKFRVTATELEAFFDLHVAVGGQETPFYYYPDTDNPGVRFFVRKDKDFMPQELESPVNVDGEIMAVFDYEMTLTGEVEVAEIAE